jgi:hypothetical protein
VASALAILRKLMRLPVLGLARLRRFAKATASGRSSTCGLRPSHFPFSWRTRSRVAQLGDQTGLLVLCKRTGDLAHHLPRRVVARRQIIPRGRQKSHPSADQEGNTQLLGHQLARKPAGILNDDDTHAVALDPIQKGREARACLDRVRPGYGRVVELIDDPEPGALGEALNGVALAFLAVLVGADVGRR